jgi:hypothetical protein
MIAYMGNTPMFFYVNADNTNVRFKLALGDQPSNGQG